VVLAGGLGRRIGGSKATVELHGRPLISYPVAALQAVLPDVVIVAKADTELPSPPGATVWLEPQAPRHPLVGIVHALGVADGRLVLVCAGDLPLVTSELVQRILSTEPGDAPAVVPACAGALQPLLALYLPAARGLLEPAAGAATRPMREAVAAIGPRVLAVDDDEAFFNVNTPEDLRRAAALLTRR
jgi:molybdopterin-guanine dinucleotide biosynthesis protein A